MFKVLRTLVLVAVLGVSVAQAQELAVNGGFETGNFNGWTNLLNAVVNDNAAPHTGSRNARFANGTLSQTFATVPGLTYIFSYFLGHTGTNTLNSMTVTLNDGGLNAVQFLANQGATAYAQTVYTYVAATTSATIRFTSTFTNGAGRFVLDDVSFQAQGAPEISPVGALPFFCVSLLLALGLERRKRESAHPGAPTLA